MRDYGQAGYLTLERYLIYLGSPAPRRQALTYVSSKGKKVSMFISEDDETTGCSS